MALQLAGLSARAVLGCQLLRVLERFALSQCEAHLGGLPRLQCQRDLQRGARVEATAHLTREALGAQRAGRPARAASPEELVATGAHAAGCRGRREERAFG